MGRATLKNLLAHKLRLLLTALAIVLGTSFVSGTFVLTDTVRAAFDDLFGDIYQGIDVVVRPEGAVQQDPTNAPDPMPSSLLKQVQAVDGVRHAEGSVEGFAQIIGKDGEPAGTFGAPALAVAVNPGSPIQSETFRLADGRAPETAEEVVIDSVTAENEGFEVGDTVEIVPQGGKATSFTLVGILDAGESGLLGATLSAFDLGTAQRLFDKQGKLDEIDVLAAPGVDAGELRQRVDAAIGDDYEVFTGTQFAEENSEAIGGFISDFLTPALLAFAFVALLVGAFLIFNTFAIVLVQRTRELALLRCMGASRRQVLNSVLLEAGLVGLIAAAGGVVLGIGVAAGLRSALGVFGLEIPATETVLQPRTVIVALLVGVVVTMLAALLPALKATRIPPVAALREEATAAPHRGIRRRTIAGAIVTGLGIATLVGGLFGGVGNALVMVGVGALLVFFGVAILSPLVARPLARVIGWPFAKAFRTQGKLARQNAMRSPRRTASTAAALMIGLALVTFVTIFADSLKTSIFRTVEQTIAADFSIMPSTFGGFSPDVARELGQRPEFAAVAASRFGSVEVAGDDQGLQAIDPAEYTQVVEVPLVDGSLDALGDGGVAVREDLAEEHGWSVGDTIPMTFRETGTKQVPVEAVYEGADGPGPGPLMISIGFFRANFPERSQLDTQVLIQTAPGVAAADAEAAANQVLASYPNLELQDQEELRDTFTSQVNQLLGLVFSLLGLSVIIALFGIVNTLALSIFERVRELGLLRAVGMTRRQVRAMIRWESVIIAVLGALLGLGVGVFFGWITVQALEEQGINVLSIPLNMLVIFVVLAAVAGILAAILPARRAAKVDVLRAVTVE